MREDVGKALLDLMKSIGEIEKLLGSRARWDDLKRYCERLGLKDCDKLLTALRWAIHRKTEGGAGPHVEVFRRAKELEARGRRILHLEVGEPPWGPPSFAVDALVEALREGKVRYSDPRGEIEFREAASDWIRRRDSVEVGPEDIVVTPGSKFAIFAILKVALRPGERVAVFRPFWPAYRGIAAILDLELVELNSIDEISMLDDLGALVLCSPNNPDGRVLGRKELEEISDMLNDLDALLISDDAYAELSFVERTSPLAIYDKAVSVNTMSKAFGMTGFRLGYMASRTDLIGRLTKFLSVTVTNVPAFLQAAGAEALSRGPEWVPRVKEELQGYLRKIEKIVDRDLLNFEKPEGGLYVFPEIPDTGMDSMELALSLLEEKGVAVAPGEGFGPYKRNIRLTYASKDLDEALPLIEEFLKERMG